MVVQGSISGCGEFFWLDISVQSELCLRELEKFHFSFFFLFKSVLGVPVEHKILSCSVENKRRWLYGKCKKIYITKIWPVLAQRHKV